MAANGPETNVQVEKIEGKELTPQDKHDLETINNFLNSKTDQDDQIKGVLKLDSEDPTRKTNAVALGIDDKVLYAYDNLRINFKDKIEFFNLKPIENLLAPRQGNAFKFKEGMEGDTYLQDCVTKGQTTFNEYMKNSVMGDTDIKRIENLFNNYLGLAGDNGTDVKLDRNDMERLITTTKYDENTKESKPVDQSDRTIIAHVNNVDISNYANDMPTLKQKLEDAYPGAKIDHIRPDDIQLSYSLESIYAYAANTLGDVRNVASGQNMEQTNQRASSFNIPKYNDEALGNIKAIKNLDTKQKLVKVTSTISKSAQHDAYKEINALNVKSINSALDGKTVKDIPGSTYSPKGSIDFKDPNDLINVKEPLNTDNNGNQKPGELEKIDNDIGFSKAKIGEIKGNIYEIVGNEKLNIYGLDENSYIDKLASQPTEMKSIENNLRSALRVKEDIAVDNAYNIAPSNVTNEKEWQDTQKAISDLSTTIKNDIDRVIGKFEEFYIPIDKPNDLINFAKNKEPGIKSRQDAIKKHRDDISDKLNTKINDLKKRAEVYEKSEESKAVDKIYAEFNDGNINCYNIKKGPNDNHRLNDDALRAGFAGRLLKDTYNINLYEQPSGEWKIIQKIEEKNKDQKTNYILIKKDDSGKITIDQGRKIVHNRGGEGSTNYFFNDSQAMKGYMLEDKMNISKNFENNDGVALPNIPIIEKKK